MSEIYGRVTGRKRLIVIVVGALSGLVVAILFSAFGQTPITPIELIIGAALGGFLGFSTSLGEARRKRPRDH
jgi:hypothetical protein